jgi:hypothetical protein
MKSGKGPGPTRKRLTQRNEKATPVQCRGFNSGKYSQAAPVGSAAGRGIP